MHSCGPKLPLHLLYPHSQQGEKPAGLAPFGLEGSSSRKSRVIQSETQTLPASAIADHRDTETPRIHGQRLATCVILVANDAVRFREILLATAYERRIAIWAMKLRTILLNFLEALLKRFNLLKVFARSTLQQYRWVPY